MHDANETPLKKGDIVTVECVIVDLFESENYCNVNLKTVLGRKPDGLQESIGGINTAVFVLKQKSE